jgi:hypothetical protein
LFKQKIIPAMLNQKLEGCTLTFHDDIAYSLNAPNVVRTVRPK